MAKQRKVALLVEWSRAFGRGVLHGIANYVKAHEGWKIYQTERRLCDEAPEWLQDWEGDGVIARIENKQLLKKIRKMNVPVVDLFENRGTKGIPSPTTDNRAIALLAADHLIERGFKHFAYCGLPGIYSSEIRGDFFCKSSEPSRIRSQHL